MATGDQQLRSVTSINQITEAKMSWTDLHARMALLNTVLERAEIDPTAPLLLDGLPDVERLFGGVDGLLLALQYRWNNHLTAKLDQAIENWDPAHTAWDELASEQPTLRAVLDAAARRSLPMRVAQHREQRMIDASDTGSARTIA